MNFEFWISFIENYELMFYILLFIGSLVETVFIISFFVPGEIVFLTGSILAGLGYLNIFIVIIVLIAGGVVGDNISYFWGLKYGDYLFEKMSSNNFFSKIFNKEKYQKAKDFFGKYGKFSVFFARFLGPVSWVVPFLAGNMKLKYTDFAKYNFLGVSVGIGQFIALGYFGGKNYEVIFEGFKKYIFFIIFILLILVYTYYHLKKHKYIEEIKNHFMSDKRKLFKIITKKFSIFSTVIILIYSAFLFYIFFIDKDMHENKISNVEFLRKTNKILLEEFDNSKCNDIKNNYDNNSSKIQQINIILKTDKKLNNIFEKDWSENKIFNKDDIFFKDFLNSFFDKKLPVSNLFFVGKAQDFAFQKDTKTISKRQHVRFWYVKEEAGHSVYLGSVSYDEKIKLRFYNNFIAPVHSIDKNLDKSRGVLKQFLEKRGFKCSELRTPCIVNNDSEGYYTDGIIIKCYD